MSGFVAAQAVAALAYDFTGIGVPALDDVKGVTPEPTQEQVRIKDVELRKFLGLDDDAEGEEITDAVAEKVSAMDKRADADRRLVEIYADCCSQQPTTEQMLALPHRVLAAYLGYLAGELNSPTAGSNATKPSRGSLKSV